MLCWLHRVPLPPSCLALALLLAASPLRAQAPPTCTPAELANGACLDILTRLPSRTNDLVPVLHLSDAEYIVADTAADGAFPAAASGAVSLPHVPGLPEPDAYIAKLRTDDAVAEWVFPMSVSYVSRLLRGPNGSTYVVAWTRSPRWPLPPLSVDELYPSSRSVVAGISADGTLRSVAWPTYATWYPFAAIAVDGAGNVITRDAGFLNRRDPVSFDVMQSVEARGMSILADDDESGEIVLSDGSVPTGVEVSAWRRDDFGLVARVVIPDVTLAYHGVRVGASDLYLTGVITAGDPAESLDCQTGSATLKPTDTRIYLARVSLAMASLQSIRCVGRWRTEANPQPSLLRDGRLLIAATGDALGSPTSRFDGVVYRSLDGGNAWELANGSAPWLPAGSGIGAGDVSAVVVDPANAQVAYATTSGGVRKTSNAGALWTDITWTDITPASWWRFSRVTVNPLSPSELWVQGSAQRWGLLHSTDAGATWDVRSEMQMDMYTTFPVPTFFDPAAPSRVWSFGAAAFSDDKGSHWMQWEGTSPGNMAGGSMLAGTPLGRRYGSGLNQNSGLVWAAGDMPWTMAPGIGRPAFVAVDPHRLDRAFAVLQTGGAVATRNGGASWFTVPLPVGQFELPPLMLAASRPGDPETSLLLRATETRSRQPSRTVLFSSADSGASWTERPVCSGCVSFSRAESEPSVLFGFGPQPAYRLYQWWNVGATTIERAQYVPTGGETIESWFPGLSGVMTAWAFDTDEDTDGLPNGWERQFGAAAGDRDGDPDGDGLSNLQERDAGSHPVGRYVYACAEAGTSDSFATRIDMFNPDPATVARVLVRYGMAFDPDGRKVLLIPPGATRAVDLTNGQLRFEGGEHPVIVESDVPLAVTRTFTWGTWGITRVGQHAGTCVTPAPDWHFAEGSTALSFQVFYILFNPTADTTTVRVTFLRTAPLTPIVRNVELAAGARSVLWVNAEVPEATNRDVAASFASIDHTPFVVERSMYMKASGEALFGGGTNANGTTTPGTRWYIAEGATGGLFDTYILLANPGDVAATVQLSYVRSDGIAIVRTHGVPARSRISISVAAEDAALAATSFATEIVSTNGVAVVAERATWWSTAANAAWWQSPSSEGHVNAASNVAGAAWMVAGGADAATSESYVLVGKFSEPATTVMLRLHFTDGTLLEQAVPLAAGARRVTLPVIGYFTHAQLDGRAFAVSVVAADPNARLVVELSQYRSSTVWWSAGTSVGAVPLPLVPF